MMGEFAFLEGAWDLHLGVRNGLTTMLYSAAAAIVDDATFLSGKILQSRYEDMTCYNKATQS